MSWNGYPSPRRGMWQETNSPAVPTHCVIPTLRTGILASKQHSTISFLYTHLNIRGALKGRAGGVFSMLLLIFCYESLVRINWDAGLICWEKETLFHLLKSNPEAFIHLLFIQCSFLASFLFPATQCSIIMKAFKVMKTILRTYHFGKKLTIFLYVGKKGPEICLNYEGHTHTLGKCCMISENYLIEPQLERVTQSCSTQSAYDTISCSPLPHGFFARLLKQESYRILNTGKRYVLRYQS